MTSVGEPMVLMEPQKFKDSAGLVDLCNLINLTF